jgi:hypothetical protein
MRKKMSVCAVALLAAVIVGGWAMTTTAKAPPEVVPAAMNPFELMLKAIELPIHIIVDPL